MRTWRRMRAARLRAPCATLISRWRAVARDSMRFAMLAQASSSTRPAQSKQEVEGLKKRRGEGDRRGCRRRAEVRYGLVLGDGEVARRRLLRRR